MADEQLVSFISKARAKGRSDEQIQKALLSVGWSRDRVQAAFRIAQGEDDYREEEQAPPAQAKPSVPPAAKIVPEPQRAYQAPPQVQPAAPQPVPIRPFAQPAQPAVAPARPPVSTGPTPAQPSQEASPKPVAAPKPMMGTYSPAPPQPAPAALQPAQPGYLKPMWPHESTGASPQEPQPELQTTNPAFSNLSQQKRADLPIKKYAPYLAGAALVILLLVAGYMIFLSPQQPAPQAPEPPAEAAPSEPNSTVEGLPFPDEEPEPGIGEISPEELARQKGFLPAPEEQSPPAQPEPELPPEEVPPLPDEPSVQPPPSPPPEEQPPNQTANLTRFIRFVNSAPYSPEEFCRLQDNGTFYRAHYKSHWGGDCINERIDIGGFVNATSLPQACEYLSCCINHPPLNEFSEKYDYFECGYAQ